MKTLDRSPNQGRSDMDDANYFAHSDGSKDHEQWHRLSEHLAATGERAAAFLDPVGAAEFGRVAGLLHDLGKYTQAFQERLSGGAKRINHSTAGAKVAIKRYDKLGKMLAFCIAGHHAGLANGVNGSRTTALEDRLNESVLAPDPAWKQEIELPGSLPLPRLKPREQEAAGFCAAFFIRMLFSALVDADYLDTEEYFAQAEGTPKPRGQHPTLGELLARLNMHLDKIAAGTEARPVNALRQQVLAHARRKAMDPQGLFSLTVPTGGGKTLTSLAFALAHARTHGIARVIYVIPYMSIIEQTATVFREALRGNETAETAFVVEHHSTFDEERIGEREARNKLRLAMENWDAPIIVTTAVQFFESLFSNRPSRCRKLHNIANSVVILDEAQTLPLRYLRPCVTALDELARNWRTSVVLCTATQPALLAGSDEFPGGFEHVRELAPEPKSLYERLKRTQLRHEGRMDDAALASQVRESPQALCIVNSRAHARDLYERVSDAEGAAHLTTLLCARHRREKLDAIREHLRNGAPVRLIATSLVEAGVDLDFPVVWRAEAGLESIIQAAGRCNREGHATSGDVFVFTPAEDGQHRTPPEIGQLVDAARGVMRRHPEDPMSLDAINDYFRELYWLKGDDALDAKGILRMVRERGTTLDFPFETIAHEFRLIETPMVPVIIPWPALDGDDDTARHLLRDLKRVERPGSIARRLQPYIVQIPPKARSTLITAGAAEVVREADFDQQFVVLTNTDLYDPDTGLTWHDPTFRTAEGLVS